MDIACGRAGWSCRCIRQCRSRPPRQRQLWKPQGHQQTQDGSRKVIHEKEWDCREGALSRRPSTQANAIGTGRTILRGVIEREKAAIGVLITMEAAEPANAV